MPRRAPRCCVSPLVALVFASLAVLVACRGEDPAVTEASAIARGDELMAQEKFGQAVSAYQTAVSLNPTSGALRLKLARAHQGARQWEAAARQFITAAEMLPDDWEAQTQAVRWMLGLSRFYDASARVTALLEKRPGDPELLLLLATAKAMFRNPEIGIIDVEQEMREGRHFEGARLRLRLDPYRADDREAEMLFRRAYAAAPDQFNTRIALAGFIWLAKEPDEGTELLKMEHERVPDDYRYSRALGLFYEYRERHDEAEKFLKRAAATRDRTSILTLADYYARRNRIPEALTTLTPLTAKADVDGAVAISSADFEARLGDHARARERIDPVLVKDPNHPRALRVKAQILLATGDATQALDFARRAVQASPGSRDARLVLGRALIATGDLQGAFEHYSEAWRSNTRDADVAKVLAGVAFSIGRHAIAEDLASQSLRLEPEDREAALTLVRARIRLEKFADAERALEPLLKSASPSTEVQALQGAVLAGRRQDDAARAVFQRVLQTDPDSIDALSGLVTLELRNQRPASVRPLIDEAVRRHPKHPAYLLLLARIAAAENNPVRAETALRAILETNAANEPAVLMFADLLSRQRRQAEARTAVEKALERDPAAFALRSALASLLEQLGQFAEARAQYERIIADNQTSRIQENQRALHLASARLAILLANQKIDLNRAFHLAASAREFLPNEPAVSDALGWVHVSSRRARFGVPYLEMAIKAEPGTAVFHYHLGVAHEQLANFDRAAASLTRALELGPDAPWAADARLMLADVRRKEDAPGMRLAR